MKTLKPFAAAAVISFVAAVGAQPAHAAALANGIQINGMNFNGFTVNGISLNGISLDDRQVDAGQVLAVTLPQ